MPKTKATDKPRFAYDGLSRVIHERARLSLITSLLTHPAGLFFSDLKKLCALTDGNLNRHLAVLDEAKFVSTLKTPTATRYKVTALGRKRYLEYLAALDQVISDAAFALNVHDDSPDLARVTS